MADQILAELQREWREQVLRQLNNLAEGQEKINEKFSNFEITFARDSKLEKIIVEQQLINKSLNERLNKLENVYMKAIGAAFVIQVIFGIMVAIIGK